MSLPTTSPEARVLAEDSVMGRAVPLDAMAARPTTIGFPKRPRFRVARRRIGRYPLPNLDLELQSPLKEVKESTIALEARSHPIRAVRSWWPVRIAARPSLHYGDAMKLVIPSAMHAVSSLIAVTNPFTELTF